MTVTADNAKVAPMIQISRTLMSWASILDDATLEQAKATATLPFIYPHLALMPDAHLGKGATVGSVIPTLGAIIPAAVGVDIGCGMRAVRTQFNRTDLAGKELAVLRKSIERAIPLSAGHHNSKVRVSAEPKIAELEALAGDNLSGINGHSKSWPRQLGSLGSGNHFLEVTADETGRIWLFLHSGSRGVGNRIAQHHIEVAKKVAKKMWIQLPDPDLAYLAEGTDEFNSYVSELEWAQRFAALNRDEMMDRMIDCFEHWIDAGVDVDENINCHHNYSAVEEHFGKRVWISRKGAISAAPGEPGLIPGSMGTASFVVRGLGNRLALCSSPHGAGRAYSRTRARKTFTGDDLRAAMVGIEYRDSDAFIDEIPGAYKPIEQVMADAADLVEVVHELRQLVNVKGD